MAEFQPGLHKEVAVIFKGVWDPEVDNTEGSYAPPKASSVAYYMGSPHDGKRHRGPKLATVTRALTEVPGYVFSLRSRREKKRLSLISRHLIINNTNG